MFALKLLQILFLLAFFQQAQNPQPAQPPAPAAPSSFRISGRVIDAITGHVIASTVETPTDEAKEKATDKKLTTLAEKSVNRKAA